jgi:hypothetical protein
MLWVLGRDLAGTLSDLLGSGGVITGVGRGVMRGLSSCQVNTPN